MRRGLATSLVLVVSWLLLGSGVAAASVSAVMPHYPYITYPLDTDPGDGPVDEQEVVFECDPAWGPEECPIEGIDLRNVETSVLLQMYPGLRDTARGLLFEGGPVSPPPACSPGQVGYCPGGVYYPYLPTNQFQSEMAALSWNYLMVLIAYQTPVDPENPGPDEFDPDDPMSTQPQQCSYVQPQYCASVIEFLPEPGAALGSLTALLALAALPRRSAR